MGFGFVTVWTFRNGPITGSSIRKKTSDTTLAAQVYIQKAGDRWNLLFVSDGYEET